MLEVLAISLTTFFATIAPFNVVASFAALTTRHSPTQKRTTAVRGILVAGGILLAFALIGEWLLHSMGISLAALRTAGGVLLLLIGIEMVFVHRTGGTGTTSEEESEATSRSDISIFPLATPLTAGPGTIGATIVLMAQTDGQLTKQIAVLIALAAILLMTLVFLLVAARFQRWLGITGMQVVGRIMGVLLSALAVQFIFDGIAQSGLL